MFNPWVGKIPWRRKWQPTPVFLRREFRGQRSLVGYIVHGVAKSQTQLSNYYSSNSCVFGWFLIGGCCEHACPSFCVYRSFPFFLVDSKEWNFQGHRKLCLTLPDDSHGCCTIFHSYLQSMWVQLLHIPTKTCISLPFLIQ